MIPISNLSQEQSRPYRESKDWLEIKGSPVQLLVGTNVVRHYWARVAPSREDTDWYASLSLEKFKGQEVTVRSWRATDKGFTLLEQSDTIPGQELFHREPFRPKFHFTQKTGFNNDPNGMVYHKGLWHYFWQHNPVKKDMGNQTWGHATSPDLLHWTQQPGRCPPKGIGRTERPLHHFRCRHPPLRLHRLDGKVPGEAMLRIFHDEDIEV